MDQKNLIRKMWLALIKDTVSNPAYNRVRVYFKSRNDILELISEADTIASDLLRFRERSQPYSKLWIIPDEILGQGSPRTSEELTAPAFAKVIQVLRFPKRYTPEDGVPSSLPKFWEVNDRCKAYEPDDHSFIISILRMIMHERFSGYSEADIDWSHWRLSTGADLEGHPTMGKKFQFIEEKLPNLLGESLGSPTFAGKVLEFLINKMQSVPKNYKTKRNIAKESQWGSFLSGPVADLLVALLPEYVTGEDQVRSQILCLEGSKDNSLCTIDLSSASDSISCRLCRSILPTWLYRILLKVTAVGPSDVVWHTQAEYAYHQGVCTKLFWENENGTCKGYYKPHKHTYGMIATMGNRITFPLEEHIFSAVMEAATLLAYGHTDVYGALCGDDIIIANELAPTVMDILEAIGFEVNREKSYYGNEFFRESCGMEALAGVDVSSHYWPRKVVEEGDYPTLIALQHRFYNYPTVNDVITAEIRRVFPKVTESFPGSEYDDIWDEYPNITRIPGSYQKGCEPKNPADSSCELHTTVMPVYNGRWDERSERYNYYQWLKNPDLYLDEEFLPGYRKPCNHSAMNSEPGRYKLRNRKYLN